MSDNTGATRITQVATVFVPVADQDRALAFYVDKLGFEQRVDFVYGDGHRWVEVAPPGSAIAIALVPPSEGISADGDAARCALTTEDIESDHTNLRALGVSVDDIGATGTSRSGLVSPEVTVPDPVPRQFFLRDLDGNRLLVVESA